MAPTSEEEDAANAESAVVESATLLRSYRSGDGVSSFVAEREGKLLYRTQKSLEWLDEAAPANGSSTHPVASLGDALLYNRGTTTDGRVLLEKVASNQVSVHEFDFATGALTFRASTDGFLANGTTARVAGSLSVYWDDIQPDDGGSVAFATGRLHWVGADRMNRAVARTRKNVFAVSKDGLRVAYEANGGATIDDVKHSAAQVVIPGVKVTFVEFVGQDLFVVCFKRKSAGDFSTTVPIPELHRIHAGTDELIASNVYSVNLAAGGWGTVTNGLGLVSAFDAESKELLPLGLDREVPVLDLIRAKIYARKRITPPKFRGDGSAAYFGEGEKLSFNELRYSLKKLVRGAHLELSAMNVKGSPAQFGPGEGSLILRDTEQVSLSPSSLTTRHPLSLIDLATGSQRPLVGDSDDRSAYGFTGKLAYAITVRKTFSQGSFAEIAALGETGAATTAMIAPFSTSIATTAPINVLGQLGDGSLAVLIQNRRAFAIDPTGVKKPTVLADVSPYAPAATAVFDGDFYFQASGELYVRRSH